MKCLLVLLALLPVAASPAPLQPTQSELAVVLGFGEEIAKAPRNAPLVVRIYSVPLENYECEHVDACPDVRLLIAVSNGDQGEQPVLYELPMEKGWVFKGWLATPAESEGKVGFALETTVPGANMDPTEMKDWKPRGYRVWLDEDGASYERLVAQESFQGIDLTTWSPATDQCPGGTVSSLRTRLMVSGPKTLAEIGSDVSGPARSRIGDGDSLYSIWFSTEPDSAQFWGFNGYLVARGDCITYAEVTSHDN